MLAALAFAVAFRADADPGSEDPGERARALLEAGGYQTMLPEGQAIRVPAPVSPFGTALFWLAALFVVALCIWFLARELGFGGDAATATAVAAGEHDGRATAASSLAESDRLAAGGRFDEAIHVLLLVAIGHLARESGREPRVSTTARELIRTFGLDGDRRAAFSELVRAVEWSLFGGRPVDGDDYRRCRETFHTLVRA